MERNGNLEGRVPTRRQGRGSQRDRSDVTGTKENLHSSRVLTVQRFKLLLVSMRIHVDAAFSGGLRGDVITGTWSISYLVQPGFTNNPRAPVQRRASRDRHPGHAENSNARRETAAHQIQRSKIDSPLLIATSRAG